MYADNLAKGAQDAAAVGYSKELYGIKKHSQIRNSTLKSM